MIITPVFVVAVVEVLYIIDLLHTISDQQQLILDQQKFLVDILSDEEDTETEDSKPPSL